MKAYVDVYKRQAEAFILRWFSVKMKAARVCELLFYVGIPYFPGQSPGKYFRRSRA